MAIERTDCLVDGKSKQVWATTDPDRVVLAFKDDATAFNGARHAIVPGKGRMNGRLSAFFFGLLGQAGVRHHFVEAISDTELLCRRVSIVGVEVVVRNVIAGSFAARYGRPEGEVLPGPVVEFFVKSDALGDPPIGVDAAVALGLAHRWELHLAAEEALRINDVLRGFWSERGVDLVDIKLEFGRTGDGMPILADEITPDGCRLWERGTGRRLDKDVFRRDLADLSETYAEVLRRAGLSA